MAQAARISDFHTCPDVEPGPTPHVGGPVRAGDPTVLIGYQPAARVGDSLVCIGPPDTIIEGAATVTIGGKKAARRGDGTSHGGVIVAGCPTVIVGESDQVETLQTDKPFCEECEKARKRREGNKGA